MKLFTLLTPVAILALVLTAGCGRPDSGNDAIVVKSEIPTGNFDLPNSPLPAPTETAEPEPDAVDWTRLEYINENFYVMVDADGDGQSDLPEGCNYSVHFGVTRSGEFSINDSCTGYGRSGTLSAAHLARINKRAARINIEEVSSNLLCELYNAPVGYPGKSAYINLQNAEGKSFNLWKGFGAQICFPKNRSEIAALHAEIWSVLKSYVTLDFAK
jgi:hypothetical protein